MRKILARPEAIPIFLFIATFVLAAAKNRYFLDFGYLLETTSLFAEGALLVIAMSFIIVAGQIDLSVGAMMALVACAFGKLLQLGLPMPLAILAALGLGAVLGSINGALVAYLKLPSFLVTLGTMALFRGAAQAMLASQSVALPPNFVGIDRQVLAFIHLPIPLFIVLIFALLGGLALHFTHFGKRLFAIGTNEAAARYAGIRVARAKVGIFVISGVLAAVAGMMIDSRLAVARYDHGKGLELEVITATVLGGVSIAGGKGSLGGALIAYALIAVVRTALGLANANAEIQLTVLGTLLILAVGVNRVLESRTGARRITA